MSRTDEHSERTYLPTPLRLAEARRRGQVARSADLAAAATLLAGLAALGLLGPRLLGETVRLTESLLDRAAAKGVPSGGEVLSACSGMLWTLAPMVLAVVLAAIAGNIVQVGFLATSEAFSVDFSRLRPGGRGRVFSLRAAVRLGLAAAKVAAVGAIALGAIWDGLAGIVASAGLGAAELAAGAGQRVLSLGFRLAAALLAMAALDWLFQRWQHRQDLKMTRREWLDDLRRMEGDPALRRKRSRMARGVRAGTAKEPTPSASSPSGDLRRVDDVLGTSDGRTIDHIE